MNVSVVFECSREFLSFLIFQGILVNLGVYGVIALIFNIPGVFLVILFIHDIIVILKKILRIFWSFEDLDGFLVNFEVP